MGEDEPGVFVTWLDREQDLWSATWQSGTEHRSMTGTRDVVLGWAARQGVRHVWVWDGERFSAWDSGTTDAP